MSLKRRLLPAALFVSFATAFVALGTVPAQAADDQITGYAAEATLTKDGVLQVKETVDLTAGSDTFRRTLTNRVRSDAERDRSYDISDVSATVNGKPADGLENSEVDNGRQISVKVSGQSKVVYSYTVHNVVADSTEGREVSWPIVQGFGTPIPKATVVVNVPFATWVTCFAGPRRLEHAVYVVAACRERGSADRAGRRTGWWPADLPDRVERPGDGQAQCAVQDPLDPRPRLHCRLLDAWTERLAGGPRTAGCCRAVVLPRS
ncbi:DUF2207 domain-containing protein [Kribbella qitaiheensis]|uniref:DUF2207 domain-containing protein n=1 Tax=Kribbella qitaiheensis TaxID=1544730 RepID=UPI0031B5DD2A